MRFLSKRLAFGGAIVLLAAGWGATHSAQASGLITSAYNLIENGGTPVTREPTLNFVNGGCVDNSGAHSTDCTISGGGGGSGITVYAGTVQSLPGTLFVPIGGSGTPLSEADMEVGSPVAATVSNLSVSVGAPPGTGQSLTFAWRDNGATTHLSCTISGATATTCADNTDSISVAAADLLDIQITPSGTFTPFTLVIATQFGSLTSPGVRKYNQSFSGVTSVVLTDNLNTTTKTTQCYDSASPPNLIEPQNIAITDANDVTVTFTSSQTGSCIVQG
jgi:hypothetical protein